MTWLRLVIFSLVLLNSKIILADCASPVGTQGQVTWNSTYLEIRYCNGTNWKSGKYGKMSQRSTLTDTSTNQINSIGGYATSNNNLFIIESSQQALYTIDATDILNPVVTSKVVDAQYAGLSVAEVTGNYLILTGSKFLVVDISNPVNPVIVANIAYGGSKIKIVGNYAYLLSSTTFRIIDITNKSSPAALGSVALSSAYGLAISGTYAYVSHSSAALTIINISIPTSPTVSGTLSTANLWSPGGIGVSGNYVYIAGDGGGSTGRLSIVDVTNKSAPLWISGIDNTANFEGISDIFQRGNNLYILQSNGRNSTNYVTTYDVSNSAVPSEIYQTAVVGESGSYCTKIYIGSQRGICTGGNSILHLFDSSSKQVIRSSPSSSIYSPDPTNMSKLVAKGNLAVAMDTNEALFVYDITDPSSMVPKGAWQSPHDTNIYSLPLEFDGTYAYMGLISWSSIYVIDVATNPMVPKLVKTLSGSCSQPYGLKISGSYLYAACSNGITVFDISDPLNGTFVSHLDIFTPLVGSSDSVGINGNLAFVGSSDYDQVAVVDITNKTSMVLLGTVTDATNLASVNDIVGSGNYAFVAAGSRLTVIDVSVPSAPAVVTSLSNSTSLGYKMSLSGNYIYSSGSSNLSITDISNPLAPSVVRTFASGGGSPSVVGTNMFAITSNSLKSYNVTVPASATATSTSQFLGSFAGGNYVAASGNYAYVTASTRHQLQIIDVTDRNNPAIVKTLTDATKLASAKAVAVSGNYAFVVGTGYLTVIDISVPSLASIVGYLADGVNLASAVDVYISGNYAIVINGSSVTAVNISVKTAPVFSNTVSSGLMSGCLRGAISGNYIFVSCATSTSIGAVNISNPASMTISSVFQDVTNLAGAGGVETLGAYLIVGTTPGLAVLNISNPVSISFIKSHAWGAAKSFSLMGNYLAFADADGMNFVSTYTIPTLKILDTYTCRVCSSATPKIVSTSQNLFMIASSSLEIWNISAQESIPEQNLAYVLNSKLGSLVSVAHSGNYAYAGSGTNMRITSIDISNPDSPTIADSFYDGSYEALLDMAINGTELYNTTNNSWYRLSTTDITDPNNISMKSINGSFSYNWYARKIVATPTNYFWTSYNQDRITKSPGTSLSLGASAAPYGFGISGNYAYVCLSGTSELKVVDITSMTVVATLAGMTGCRWVTAGLNHVYVTSTTLGLIVVNVSTPTAPAILTTLSDSVFTGATDIQIIGNVIYALASSKFSIFDVTDPANPFLLSTVPFGFSQFVINGNYVYGVSGNTFYIYDVIPPIPMDLCSIQGEFVYDGANNVYKFCDGSRFFAMGPVPGTGGAGCGSPVGERGDLRFITSDLTLKYCDGASWIAVGL